VGNVPYAAARDVEVVVQRDLSRAFAPGQRAVRNASVAGLADGLRPLRRAPSPRLHQSATTLLIDEVDPSQEDPRVVSDVLLCRP
jgi:hypothetical protein